MFLDLHTGFSGGRYGGLVFPSLRTFNFVVIHTAKGFGIVDKAEIDGLLKLSCSFDDPAHVGNLEVVKQEMARVNINILGISELKWTAMGEFNSDDRYIYYCG